MVPVGDRLVGDVDERHVADIGIGARPEPELVAVRRQADIDRQHPQLLEQLEQAPLGRDRQRHDEEIEPRVPRELRPADRYCRASDSRRRRARPACCRDRRTCRRCGCRYPVEASSALIKSSAAGPPPDDHGAAVETSLSDPAPDQQRHGEPFAEQRDESPSDTRWRSTRARNRRRSCRERRPPSDRP